MRSHSFVDHSVRSTPVCDSSPPESRVCPSVSVNTIPLQTGNELQIVGDGNADKINIADQGNGHIDVTNGNGKVLGSADNVTLIKLAGKDGQDTINYTLVNTLTNTEKVVLNLVPRPIMPRLICPKALAARICIWK